MINLGYRWSWKYYEFYSDSSPQEYAPAREQFGMGFNIGKLNFISRPFIRTLKNWITNKRLIFSVLGMRISLVSILFLLLSCSSSLSQSTSTFSEALNDKQILDRLVHSQRYDRRIKPDIKPLHVNVSVVLLSLSSPDESSLHYEVEFLMHQRWTDPRQGHPWSVIL